MVGDKGQNSITKFKVDMVAIINSEIKAVTRTTEQKIESQ